MNYEHLVVEVKDKTLWVGLNLPRIRNAFNLQNVDEIIHAFTQLDEDPTIGCGVLYGVGDHGPRRDDRPHLEQ